MLGSELHKLKKDQKLQRHHYEKMKMIFKKNKQTACAKRDARNRSIQSSSVVMNGGRSKSRRANDSSNSEQSVVHYEIDKRLLLEGVDLSEKESKSSHRGGGTGRKGTGRS